MSRLQPLLMNKTPEITHCGGGEVSLHDLYTVLQIFIQPLHYIQRDSLTPLQFETFAKVANWKKHPYNSH